MSYKKILAKLESLPSDEQEFAAGKYVFEVIDGKTHCGCAIGKTFSEEHRLDLKNSATNAGGVGRLIAYLDRNNSPFDSFLDEDTADRRKRANEEFLQLDIGVSELSSLQMQNDCFLAGSNNEIDRKLRYWYIIGWLRGMERKPIDT